MIMSGSPRNQVVKTLPSCRCGQDARFKIGLTTLCSGCLGVKGFINFERVKEHMTVLHLENEQVQDVVLDAAFVVIGRAFAGN